MTTYPEMAGLYGTAYADNRGSEKYSSDFGWSATTSGNKEKGRKKIIKDGSYLHKLLRKKTHLVIVYAKDYSIEKKKKFLSISYLAKGKCM